MVEMTTQDWAVDALGALAHETRLSVFRMLVKAGPEGFEDCDDLAADERSCTTHGGG